MTFANGLKSLVSIEKQYETEEPMSCERIGCEEDLNGLNHYYLDLGAGYVFDLWLCDRCSKKFKKLGGETIMNKVLSEQSHKLLAMGNPTPFKGGNVKALFNGKEIEIILSKKSQKELKDIRKKICEQCPIKNDKCKERCQIRC